MSTDAVKHPYFPRDTHLPHYRPNINSIGELLGLFFGLVAVLIVVILLTTKRKSTGVRIKICWFVSCGFIHSVLEGYFSVYHASLAGEQTFLAQMWGLSGVALSITTHEQTQSNWVCYYISWLHSVLTKDPLFRLYYNSEYMFSGKEYGKGDSRYVASDTCMVAVESITAFFDGPLCFLTAAAFVFQQGAKYRYVLQLVVSLCQLYGDTVFFSTEIIDGFKHSEMWHPLHFWFYFFFLNIIWIVIPSINILDACISICRAQETADKANPSKKSKAKKIK